MLQVHQIKKEPTNSSGSKKSSVCTCKKKKSNVNSKNKKQVLVNFGLSRKKVFSLNEEVSLHDQFTSYVLKEPAFSSLLKDSYVVFQEFNEKFGSWVDVDKKKDFEDGTVLTAVFFPQRIERDDDNPGSIRKSEKDTQRTDCKKVIEIELSEDDSDESEEKGFIDNSCSPDENHHCAKQKNKSEKDKTIEEDSKDTSKKQTNKLCKLKRQKKSSLGESKLESSNESKKQTKKLKKSSSSGSLEVKNPEKPTLLPISNGTVTHDAPHTNNTSQRTFSKEMSGQNGWNASHNWLQNFCRSLDPVQDLQKLCSVMKWLDPVYDIQENPLGYACKVLVNDKLYFARHKNSKTVVDIAADKVLKALIPHDKNYVYRQHQRPYENGYYNNNNNNMPRS